MNEKLVDFIRIVGLGILLLVLFKNEFIGSDADFYRRIESHKENIKDNITKLKEYVE